MIAEAAADAAAIAEAAADADKTNATCHAYKPGYSPQDYPGIFITTYLALQMEKRQLHISYLQYETSGNLPEQDARVLESAKHALRLAYAPYSRFRVGAAALLANSEIVEGANYENASYPLCLCAERAALAAAVSKFPEIPVQAMAVTGENSRQPVPRPATPCGACRQVLAETEIKNRQAIRLILQGQTGPVWIFENSRDLLPFGFDGSFLSESFLDGF